MPAFFRMKLSEYRQRSFVGTPPCLNTLKRMIRDGELPGEIFAGAYYVFVDGQGNLIEQGSSPTPAPRAPKTNTGNELADRLLRQYAERVKMKGVAHGTA